VCFALNPSDAAEDASIFAVVLLPCPPTLPLKTQNVSKYIRSSKGPTERDAEYFTQSYYYEYFTCKHIHFLLWSACRECRNGTKVHVPKTQK
jgi:hypothetical protein